MIVALPIALVTSWILWERGRFFPFPFSYALVGMGGGGEAGVSGEGLWG